MKTFTFSVIHSVLPLVHVLVIQISPYLIRGRSLCVPFSRQHKCHFHCGLSVVFTTARHDLPSSAVSRFHAERLRRHPLWPFTVQEALSKPDASEWQRTMDAEVLSCLESNVWEPRNFGGWKKRALTMCFVLDRKGYGRERSPLLGRVLSSMATLPQ
jgi:hypothetical protein